MKLIFLAITITLFVASFCLAQENSRQKLIPYEENEKWGYINDKGKIIIKPQFDEAGKFSEGLALVSIGLNKGFINDKAEFIIEPKYRCAFSFSEGVAPVAEDCRGSWGYIDKKGATVIEPRFDWAGQFSDGLAKVLVSLDKNSSEGKTGYIDKTGKFAIEPRFSYSERFSDGLAMFAEDKKREDGMSAYFNRKAFIDTKGNVVSPFFDKAESFSEGLAAVEIDNRWGFIDKSGNIIIAPQFDLVIRGFSEGIAFVSCDNDKNAAID
ncbi:MAG TPA: WG repeat-containing protein, partial [Flavobacterium sp.]|nr:WG repeat-containing protein [Flavobacterium sp.]